MSTRLSGATAIDTTAHGAASGHRNEARALRLLMLSDAERHAIRDLQAQQDALVRGITRYLRVIALIAGTGAGVAAFAIAAAWGGDAARFPLQAALAFCTGTLGGVAVTARRLGYWAAKERVTRNFRAWYDWRPVIGGLIGLGALLVAAAGLLVVPGMDPAHASVPAIAALAFLAGMFAKQATDRFNKIADAVFGERDGEDIPPRDQPGRDPEP